MCQTCSSLASCTYQLPFARRLFSEEQPASWTKPGSDQSESLEERAEICSLEYSLLRKRLLSLMAILSTPKHALINSFARAVTELQRTEAVLLLLSVMEYKSALKAV